MIAFYVLQLRMGSITLEQVPEFWRDKVKAALGEEAV